MIYVDFRLLLAYLLLSIAVRADEVRSCNFEKEFCLKKYDETVYIGAHNSPFVGSSPVDNQNNDVQKQLHDGVRLLTAQVHWPLDMDFGTDNKYINEMSEVVSKNIDKIPSEYKTMHVCHTACFLRDAGTLQDYVQQILDWLGTEAQKDEVVSLIITNPSHHTADEVGEALEKATGFLDNAFVDDHDIKTNGWPLLGDIIDGGKRLIVFMGLFHFLRILHIAND